MYLVVIAWLYVAVMMAVAEANHPLGTLLGACVTFVLYGVGPVSLVLYLMATPARRQRRRQRDALEHEQWMAQQAASASGQPDRGGEAPADAIAPVRKEP